MSISIYGWLMKWMQYPVECSGRFSAEECNDYLDELNSIMDEVNL